MKKKRFFMSKRHAIILRSVENRVHENSIWDTEKQIKHLMQGK